MKSTNKQFIVKTHAFEPYISKGEIITVVPILGNLTQVYIKTFKGKTAKVEYFDVFRFCEEVAK